MEGKIPMFLMKSFLFPNLYNPTGDQLSNLYSTGPAGGISTCLLPAEVRGKVFFFSCWGLELRV